MNRKMNRIDANELKEACNGRWNEVLRDLLPEVADALTDTRKPIRCPRPDHEDIHPSFRFINLLTGRWICTCGSGDVFGLLHDIRGLKFPEALQEVANALHYTPAQNGAQSVIHRVATDKRMPIDSIAAYGGKVATRRGQDVVRFPVWNEEGVIHSHFDLAPQSKGWFKKGKGSSGLFFPGRIPQAGEGWIIVEGVKDAAALHGLGNLACGLPSDRMLNKHARLFRGCNVTIIPDRTVSAEEKARKTAGLTQSVRVAD